MEAQNQAANGTATEKKVFALDGFKNYLIFNDGTFLNTETKTAGTANAKGIVTFKSDAGKAEKMKMADLIAFADTNNGWQPYEEPTPTATGNTIPLQPAAPAKELTEEEKIKAALKAERKSRLKVVEDAKMAALQSKPEQAMAMLEAYQKAQADFDKWSAENPISGTPARILTAEEQALLDDYNETKAVYETARLESDSLLNLLKSKGEALKNAEKPIPFTAPKKGDSTTFTGSDVPERAPHLDYETAQNIRKDYASKTMTVKEIATKYGNSPASVMMIVYYQQWKLKKGDTAYTPLINKFYPALGDPLNITGTDGAPFVEDKVKETAEKYKLPAERTVLPKNADGTNKTAEQANAEDATEKENAGTETENA